MFATLALIYSAQDAQPTAGTTTTTTTTTTSNPIKERVEQIKSMLSGLECLSVSKPTGGLLNPEDFFKPKPDAGNTPNTGNNGNKCFAVTTLDCDEANNGTTTSLPNLSLDDIKQQIAAKFPEQVETLKNMSMEDLKAKFADKLQGLFPGFQNKLPSWGPPQIPANSPCLVGFSDCYTSSIPAGPTHVLGGITVPLSPHVPKEDIIKGCAPFTTKCNK